MEKTYRLHTPERVQVSLLLKPEVLHELDSFVEKRGRSRFIEELLRKEISSRADNKN